MYLLVKHITHTKNDFFGLETFESLCYWTVPMITLKSDHISIEYVSFETQLYPDLPWDEGQNDLGSNVLKVKELIESLSKHWNTAIVMLA